MSDEELLKHAKDFMKNSNSGQAPVYGCGAQATNVGNNKLSDCLISTYNLGMLGDTPLPGDYDGDGKANLAVYHPENFVLEIMPLSGENKKVCPNFRADFFI